MGNPSSPSAHNPTSGLITRRDMLGGMALAAAALGTGCRPFAHGKKELSLWSLWMEQTDNGFSNWKNALSARLPDCDISITRILSQQVRSKVLAAASSGSLPDVFIIDSSMLRALKAKRVAENLIPLLKSNGIALSSMVRQHDYNRNLVGSELLAMPTSIAGGNGILYRSHPLLKKAGFDPDHEIRNWAEFTEICKELTERLNPPDSLNIIGLDLFLNASPLINLSLGMGYPTVSKDGRQSLFNSEGVMNAARLIDEHIETVYGKWGGYRGLLQWRMQSSTLEMKNSTKPFGYQRAAFVLNGVWVVGWLRVRMPDLKYSVQPIPGVRGLHGCTASHGWSYVMNKETRHPEEAWKMLHFMTIDPDGNGRLSDENGRLQPLIQKTAPGFLARTPGLWQDILRTIDLDIPYEASTGNDFLQSHFFEIPYKRIAGQSMKEIMTEIHELYSAYLKSESAP